MAKETKTKIKTDEPKAVKKAAVRKPRTGLAAGKKAAAKSELIKTEAAPAVKRKRKIAPKRVKEVEPQVEENKYFAKWTERDFLRTEEETLFYRVALVATILAMAWAAQDGSWVSFLTFLTLLVVIAFELKTAPRQVAYEINIDGISIDGKLYRFEDIKSFDLVAKGEGHVVRLALKNAVFPVKEFPLAEMQDLEYMQALLEYFLPQETQEDALFSFKKEKRLSEDEFIEEKVDEYLRNNP